MDEALKDYLNSKFDLVYERIDSMNESIVKDITRLQANDAHHYKLDRDHRSVCAVNREKIKEEIDETLGRFGERLGNQEQIGAVQENRIKALEENQTIGKNNLQEWLRTALPYVLFICGFIYVAMGGGI